MLDLSSPSADSSLEIDRFCIPHEARYCEMTPRLTAPSPTTKARIPVKATAVETALRGRGMCSPFSNRSLK